MLIPTGLLRHASPADLLFGQREVPSAAKTVARIAVATLLISGLCLVLSSPAKAGDWDVTVGAGATYGPEYPGADEYSISPLPYVDVTWRDRLFLRSEQGLGGYVINWAEREDSLIEGLSVGLSVRPSESRDEDDDNRLDGLGDIDLSAEVGLFATLEVGFLEFGAELYQDVGNGHEGLRGEVSTGVGHQLTERLSVGAETFLQFGDGQYLESFFGVTGRQAARSRFGRYDAGAGLYGAGVSLSSRYQLTESWSLLGFVEYSRLVGDAADSPIVENEGAVEVGGFIAYRF
ncbi:MipA/OmpV family protein [Algihabitans albus]|uniref:MipA/OmpV family protein n=1 Tax=Algihabitans albus TaxID=2164067 RepID=UPI0013C33B99|nr:MipA/OmpV family protein [Algihabitans albus]